MRDDVSVTDWSLHTAPVANRVRRSWPRALWELVNARAANHPKNALQSHMSPTTVVRLRRRLSDHFRSGCGRCIDAASVLISGGGGFRRRRPHRRRWLKALSFPHRFSNDFNFHYFSKSITISKHAFKFSKYLVEKGFIEFTTVVEYEQKLGKSISMTMENQAQLLRYTEPNREHEATNIQFLGSTNSSTSTIT